MSNGKLLYRYERGLPSEFNYPVYLKAFKVIRETKCGYWIKVNYSEKFVLKGEGKRFAYPTKEMASNNFILRTKRCIKILKGQLSRAEQFLEHHQKSLLKIAV